VSDADIKDETMKNIALVIEDDADLSEIFTKALQAAGFEVETIQDGNAAQERLKETIPNVIVLDMHLPHVDGATLLKQIRADGRLSKARIIIATADSAQAEFYRSMATIVMIKPITFSQLRDISARLKAE
jgi:chemosensory pili system protein ChpA (sensor histidine kinase/response regulator)